MLELQTLCIISNYDYKVCELNPFQISKCVDEVFENELINRYGATLKNTEHIYIVHKPDVHGSLSSPSSCSSSRVLFLPSKWACGRNVVFSL